MRFDSDTTTGKVVVAGTVVAVTSLLVTMFHSHQKKVVKEETWDSHVKKHGELEEIWPKTLYILEASGASQGPPTRNMIVYRIPDGTNRLVIFNGIAVKDDTIATIEALGKPTVLVVPNSWHRCCAAVWKARYPNMLVVCPEVAVEKVTEILPVDETTQEWTKKVEWNKWIHAKEIDGWAPFETVLEFELESNGNGKRAMVVADLLFTIPRCNDEGMIGKFITWIFDSSIDVPIRDDTSNNIFIIPKISRIARIFGIKDWKKVEKWYRSYAHEYGSKIATILVGHGIPIKEIDTKIGCTKALEGVADQLIKPRW